MDVIEAMKKEMFRRRLSHRTVVSYVFYVKKFLLFCDKEPREFSKKDVAEFLDKYVKKEKAGNTINVVHNALRFMMVEILRKNMRLRIKYSKTPKALPVCLSKEEVRSVINSIENPKHRLMVSLMYGAGLRVSELLKLRAEDIDLENDCGWVRHGKGDKDRPFIIPKCLKNNLKGIMEHSEGYLFKNKKQMPLSVRTLQVIVSRAAAKAGLGRKRIHPHTLRHSFATHLLENNYDIATVQSLLGHNEARTTMVYLHIVKPKLINVKSPLDD